MKVLVTGAAGFIGSHLSRKLCENGHHVLGMDNLNPYYDVNLKKARLKTLEAQPHFKFKLLDLVDRAGLETLLSEFKPEVVVNLAAQAGVRYSLENPYAYVDSNLIGFVNLAEASIKNAVKHFVYASTSSVYGINEKLPFSPHDLADHPISLYAATKRANELLAHSYSAIHGLPTTGLRFFTVYGPWGRPDMALFLFTERILAGKPIQIFNHGKHARDFTFVEDIVQGLTRVVEAAIPSGSPQWKGLSPDPAISKFPYRIYNIGNNQMVPLMRYIEVLEEVLGRKAEKELLPMQRGDIPETRADISDLVEDHGYKPTTSVDVGVRKFVEWYKSYYGAVQ